MCGLFAMGAPTKMALLVDKPKWCAQGNTSVENVEPLMGQGIEKTK